MGKINLEDLAKENKALKEGLHKEKQKNQKLAAEKKELQDALAEAEKQLKQRDEALTLLKGEK